MIFPSGEANFYDFTQDHSNNDGSGINVPFVDHGSGVIATYGPDSNPVETSGILAASGLATAFSNSQEVSQTQITNFTIFNNYIHNTSGVSGLPVLIPYLSTYTVSLKYDPYAPLVTTQSVIGPN